MVEERKITTRVKGSMTEGPLFLNIILYTIPIILTSVLQLLFNAADLVIVGRFCGSISVAAVGATSSITHLLVNFFIGLSVGTGVVVARAVGAEDYEYAHKAVHTAMPTAVISGLFLTVAGVIFCEPILKLMGTPKSVLPLSSVYMRIYFSGMIFTLVYNFAASILRAVGDTKSPLIFLGIAGVINVILNIIFVTLFDMNVAGVALATMISQAVSAVLVVIALMKREDAVLLLPQKMKIYKEQLLQIVKIGLPAGIQSSLFSISNVLIQSSINSFGDMFVSGSAAAANIEAFVYVTMNSFHQTAINFISQNYGARKPGRIRKTFLICLLSVAVVGAVAGVTVFRFGRHLLSVYITDSVQAIEYGMIRLMYICLPYFLCGIMDVTTGALRGIGSSVPPMIISVLGVCGMRIAWIYTIFASFRTPDCLFLSYTVSWVLTFIVELFVFLSVYKKRCRE